LVDTFLLLLLTIVKFGLDDALVADELLRVHMSASPWESTTAMGNSFQDEAETSKERKQCKVENLDGPFEQTELEDANEDKAYQLSRDKGALESLGPPPKVRLYGIQSTPKATLIY